MHRFRTFSAKIFAAIFGVSLLCCLVACAAAYQIWSKDKKREYLDRYDVLGRVLGKSLEQMEQEAELLSMNALFVLFEKDKSGILTEEELHATANRLGITDFFVIGQDGRFLRSPGVPLEEQTNSFYDYCPGYRDLLTQDNLFQRTPVLPGFPYDRPEKFVMMANHDKTRILESCVNLNYIGAALENAIKADKNIESLGLYTPNGFELGSFVPGEGFHEGSRQAIDAPWLGQKTLESSAVFSIKVPALAEDCCECAFKNVLSEDGTYWYILRLKVSLGPLLSDLLWLRTRILAFFVGSAILSLFLARLLSGRLVRRIRRIRAATKELGGSADLTVRLKEEDLGSDEVGQLGKAFNGMVDALRESRSKALDSARGLAMAKIAGQVAHDIRSPLAALDIVAKQTAKLPEEHRTLIRQATQRISDIANNLLSQNRLNNSSVTADPAQCSVELVSAALESIVSEKRCMFAKNKLAISFVADAAARASFARVNPVFFKRALSNVINNACEATPTGSKVVVAITKDKDGCEIVIKDNGCGIDPGKLPAILEGGLSIGKVNGNGMGLANAVKWFEAWGGKFSIDSKIGVGTELRFTLQCVPAPAWFADVVHVERDRQVVVLDNDDTVEAVWRDHLTRAGLMDAIALHRCSSIDDFVTHVDGNRHVIAVCAVDYELAGGSSSGLDAIEKLGIGHMSYLVTSHFEEPSIRQRCEHLGLSMIPKYLLGTLRVVPIERNVRRLQRIS